MTQDGGGADPLERVTVQRLDGFDAVLRRMPDGSLVLEARDGGRLPELRPGERLRVTTTVRGDATYGQPARVLEVSSDGTHDAVRIRPGGERERDQQRRFVRVVTSPIDVVLDVDRPGQEPRQATGEVRDLSAGGVRALVLDDDSVSVGSRLRLQFRLPREGVGSATVDVAGEVVWAGTSADGLAALGVQFTDVDPATERRLTRWVFRRDAKRPGR